MADEVWSRGVRGRGGGEGTVYGTRDAAPPEVKSAK